MTYKEYIDKRIDSREKSIKTLKNVTILLLCFGFSLLIWTIITYFLNDNNDLQIFQIAKLGISIISFLSPLYTKGELIGKHREKIIDLEFLRDNISNQENEIIINNILSKL